MDYEAVRSQFDIPRLIAFNKYQEKTPPQHVLIANYFGFGKEKPKMNENNAELEQLLSQLPQVER